MTCKEASKLNRHFVAQFFDKAETNKEHPLWAWKLCDPETFNNLKREPPVAEGLTHDRC